MNHTFPFRWLLAACLAQALFGAHIPIPIPDLCNTAVISPCSAGSGSAVAGTFAIDSHWSHRFGASPSTPALVLWLGAPWLAFGPDSNWIMPNPPSAPLGDHFYSTTFTLPANADLATVVLQGHWITNSQGVAISLNGVQIAGLVMPGPTSLSGDWAPFTITPANGIFQYGNNLLEYHINVTQCCFSGVRVEFFDSTVALSDLAEPVPESSSVWMMLSGLFLVLCHGVVASGLTSPVCRQARQTYLKWPV